MNKLLYSAIVIISMTIISCQAPPYFVLTSTNGKLWKKIISPILFDSFEIVGKDVIARTPEGGYYINEETYNWKETIIPNNATILKAISISDQLFAVTSSKEIISHNATKNEWTVLNNFEITVNTLCFYDSTIFVGAESGIIFIAQLDSLREWTTVYIGSKMNIGSIIYDKALWIMDKGGLMLRQSDDKGMTWKAWTNNKASVAFVNSRLYSYTDAQLIIQAVDSTGNIYYLVRTRGADVTSELNYSTYKSQLGLNNNNHIFFNNDVNSNIQSYNFTTGATITLYANPYGGKLVSGYVNSKGQYFIYGIKY
jgi:hypothetical protein